MVHPKTSVLFEVMAVVVTVPRIVEDSMFTPSLEALALTEVITCVVPAVDVLIPSVVPHLDAGVGGGDNVEMFNGGISSKSPSFVSKLRLITTKTIISTLVSSLLLNSIHPAWGS